MKTIFETKKALLGIIILLCLAIAGCKGTNNAGTTLESTNETINEATHENASETEPQTKDNTGSEQEQNEAAESISYPFTYTDSLGREVIIEEEPQRVISAGPNITENICAIDAKGKLIGRTAYCNYPQSIMEIEEIGDTMTLNVEKIVELNPDVIFLTSLINPDIIDDISSHGIQVIAIYQQESLQGAYDLLTDLGQILNRQSEAKEVVDSMKEIVDKVENKVKDLSMPTVYYVISYGQYGDFTATGDTYIHEIIQLAGGDNIAKDGTNWMFSLEQLVEADPEIILVSKNYDTKALFMSEEGYKDLTAVKEGRVYEIDDDAIGRQGQRVVVALEELAKIFHPEVE